MPYKMNDKQFESVLALDNLNRYKHFMSKLGDWQQIWGAKNTDNWLLPTSSEGFTYFPLWPHPEYVKKIVNKKYSGYRESEIGLNSLLNDWLPFCALKNIKVAVFPNNDWDFLCVDPKDLKKDILAELEQYE